MTRTEVVSAFDFDVNQICRDLTVDEATLLVRFYYSLQNNRVRLNNKNKALLRNKGIHSLLMDYFYQQFFDLEKKVPKFMKIFVKSYRVGNWLLSIRGIGPVLAANFLTSFDIRKAKSAGSFWRFAGLDPTVKWDSKNHVWVDMSKTPPQPLSSKKPWSSFVKRTCFLLGLSFIKAGGTPEQNPYRLFFDKRKEYETKLNEAGKYAKAAEEILKTRNFDKNTEAYKAYSEGKLPPAHINSRALRYTVKIFLYHLYEVMHQDYYGRSSGRIYSFVLDEGKRSVIMVPNWPGNFSGRNLRELYERD